MEPKASTDPTTTPPPSTASAAPEAAPSASPAALPAKKRKPYEIVNLCARPVNLVFGDDPKSPGAGKRVLAGGDKIDDGPRDPEGNQIIWLIVRDEPLVKVRVSRGSKRVEVGTSCDTLEMH